MSKKVMVLITDGTEELEVVTIVDLLRRAELDVLLAGLNGADPVVCANGVKITPDAALSAAEGDFDAVILPGGFDGSVAFSESAEVGALLKRQEASGRLVGMICAAPISLESHKLFSGRRFTSYPAVVGRIEAHAVYEEAPVVIDGNLVTSRGPGTAMGFALSLIEQLLGPEKAKEVRDPLLLG